MECHRNILFGQFVSFEGQTIDLSTIYAKMIIHFGQCLIKIRKNNSDSVLLVVTLPLQLVFVILCVLIFPLVMYLYLCRFLYLRMMREGDFCLVGGDIAATIWGQYFSEIRGPVRFTKYFTIRYNIFPYFTIWGKYFWEITGTAAFALYTLCQKTTSFLSRIIFAQYSSHNTQMQRVAQKSVDSPHIYNFDLKTQY